MKQVPPVSPIGLSNFISLAFKMDKMTTQTILPDWFCGDLLT